MRREWIDAHLILINGQHIALVLDSGDVILSSLRRDVELLCTDTGKAPHCSLFRAKKPRGDDELLIFSLEEAFYAPNVREI